MVSAYILSFVALLKNGRVFPFLNSVFVLFVLISFSRLENISEKKVVNASPENCLTIDSVSGRNIIFIQPFTSLAGFSWKFGKAIKRKEKEVKIISVPTFRLPSLFKR